MPTKLLVMYFGAAAMPVAMFVMNLCFFVGSLFGEGRVRQGAFIYMFLYWGTIRPAMDGDLSPFMTVLSSKLA